MADPADDEVLDIFEKSKQLKICPNRIWAVAGENLPNLIPDIDLLLVHDLGNGLDFKDDHAECTPDFCEQAQRDFTGVQQRHECIGEDCAKMVTSFPRHKLYDAVIKEIPTAWDLSGEFILRLDAPYMAISHVWSDGTGAGSWKDGPVNECLYVFFGDIAKSFGCLGIWWDTISIPREKAARTKAIKKMHTNYEDARFTLVHDCFLRDWPWDPRTACFGIIMSPWFSRGWTALELIKSSKVKIIFKGPGGNPVIKDLDEEILANENDPDTLPSIREASRVIRNLRGAISTLNNLLTVLHSRFTSWPKDIAVISALLVGVPVQERQQDIFKAILRKFGRITPGHLFHGATTMSTTFTWCPSELFNLPLDPSDPSLTISEEGDVSGKWRVLPVHPAAANQIWWKGCHPLIQRQLKHALKDTQRCVFLAECGCQPIERALLVRKTQETSRYQYIGAVFFRSKLSEPESKEASFVTISSFQNEKKLENLQILSCNLTEREEDVTCKTEQPDNRDQIIELAFPEKSDMLWRAILRNNYSDFISLLDEETLEAYDIVGRRPLHLAAERGNKNMVEPLISIGANLNTLCDKEQTALHYAAWSGSVAVVQLLKERIDQTATDEMEIPLYMLPQNWDLHPLSRLSWMKAQ